MSSRQYFHKTGLKNQIVEPERQTYKPVHKTSQIFTQSEMGATVRHFLGGRIEIDS